MQIIYAAPFVLLSIVSFFVCLVVPRFRKFALPALLIPVSFGVCSVVGWIAFILIAEKVVHFRFEPGTGVVTGLLFYLIPGVVGAYLTLRLVRIIEKYLLNTETSRNIAIRLVVAGILALIGGFVGLGLADNYLPPGSTVASLWLALLTSVVSAIFGFALAMLIQRRAAQLESRPA